MLLFYMFFTYLFKSNAEPLISAELENEFVDVDTIQTDYLKLISAQECTIVDADYSLLSPIAPNMQNSDIVKRLQIPILLVVEPDENTIGRTLANIAAAQSKGLLVNGVVINNIKEGCPKKLLTSITRVIEEYSNVNILGLLPYLGERVRPEDLITGILNGIDIESVFKVKIEKLDLN